MKEHEVPTHVQAEDRVLLWFTFPQVVALIAVCALSYGAYHYAPGPSEARMALAVLLGLFGVAMVVGKIGGRRLPLVAADLLKYRLGARLYVGPVSQLARSGPPAPVESGPGPLSLMSKRGRRGSRRMRVMARRGLRRMRKSRSRRNGRMPFRPHGWFGKRRGRNDRRTDNVKGRQAAGREGNEKRSKGWRSLMPAVALAVLVAVIPQAAVADGDEPEESQTFPEIEFEIPETVPGRRIFVEGAPGVGRRGRRHPARRHQPGPPRPGLRWAGRPRPPILGIGEAGRGRAHRLLASPQRPGPVPHILLGGRAGSGGSRHRQGGADPVPASRRRRGALRPESRLARLDAGNRRGSGRVRVRD